MSTMHYIKWIEINQWKVDKWIHTLNEHIINMDIEDRINHLRYAQHLFISFISSKQLYQTYNKLSHIEVYTSAGWNSKPKFKFSQRSVCQSLQRKAVFRLLYSSPGSTYILVILFYHNWINFWKAKTCVLNFIIIIHLLYYKLITNKSSVKWIISKG